MFRFLHSFEDFYRKLGSTMGNTAGKGRNTPGRSLLPRRERDIFPKSPVNPALKKSTKDDDKDNRLEAEVNIFSYLINKASDLLLLVLHV